jgi:thioredoxin 1
MEVEVTENNYQSVVEKSALPVLLDAWAPWCPPCRAIAPYIAELAKTYSGKLTVAKLNADEAPNLAQQLGITGLPTLRVLKGGKVLFETIGLSDRAKLVAAIDAAIK